MSQQLEITKTISSPRDTARIEEINRSRVRTSTGPSKRTLITYGVAAAYALLVLGGLVFLANSAAYQSTDDAFIDGHIVPISAKIAGRVQNVYVTDNQDVEKGATVVELDPRDLDAAARQKSAAKESAVAQAHAAQAGLEQAMAHVRTIEATADSDRATADADKAQDDKAQSDWHRNEELFKTKVVSPSDVDQFRAAAKASRATFEAAQKKVASDEAQVAEARSQVNAFAAVLESIKAKIGQADADLAAAQLNQSYTLVKAPEAGRVTQKSVEPGAYVQAGQNLFALVPKNVWVTANFKEDQIGKMRVGQHVEIAVDALHGQKFSGHVDSLQAGSGARFSLLPPENATGNYVKVVQRVPVKIVFDKPLQSDLPIGPGESVVPTVKVSGIEFAPFKVAIALVVLVAGVFLILRKGLRTPSPKGRVATANR
jgi:membrane fusion protein (multidrug efflux system)